MKLKYIFTFYFCFAKSGRGNCTLTFRANSEIEARKKLFAYQTGGSETEFNKYYSIKNVYKYNNN